MVLLAHELRMPRSEKLEKHLLKERGMLLLEPLEMRPPRRTLSGNSREESERAEADLEDTQRSQEVTREG